jgi:hypothetical protein
MAEGLDALTLHVARIRRLSTLAERAAPRVADELRDQLLEQVEGQIGPDGKPWAPTRSGRPALRGVSRSLSVRAVGRVVIAELEGIHARHHRGAVRGGVRRPVLPPGGTIPPRLESAVERILAEEFAKTMGGTS